MLKSKVLKIMERYAERYPFDGEGKQDRWLEAARFLTQWDLSDSDFQSMYRRAIGDPSVNIVNHKNAYPAEGILELCTLNKDAEKRIKKEFQKLSSYEEDLDERQKHMDIFRDNVNEMLKKAEIGTNRWKQDTHAAMTYLFMMQPKENYMFSSAESGLFAAYTGFKGRIGNGKSFKMKEYYRMCSDVQKIIQEEPELMEKIRCKVREQLEKENFDLRIVEEKDPDWHILVYDLILRASEDKLYYTEEIMPPDKSYTEDMIKQIRQQEDQKDLEKELLELEEHLKELQEKEKNLQLPDLTGKDIKIKKKRGFGRITGHITSCDGRTVRVQLPEREAKYAISAIVSGLVILEDQSLIEPYRQQENINDIREKLEKEKQKKQDRLHELAGQVK